MTRCGRGRRLCLGSGGWRWGSGDSGRGAFTNGLIGVSRLGAIIITGVRRCHEEQRCAKRDGQRSETEFHFFFPDNAGSPRPAKTAPMYDVDQLRSPAAIDDSKTAAQRKG